MAKHGLYKYSSDVGRTVKLASFVLGSRTTPEELRKAEELCGDIVEKIEQVQLEVNAARVEPAETVAEAMEKAREQGAQCVILLAGSGPASKWYYSAKDACLQETPPGLSHLASQWVNLAKPSDHQW